MTREEAKEICLDKVNKHKCILCNLVTGFGKSKLAIDMTNKVCDNVYKTYGEGTSVLILVPKRNNINEWNREITKWGGLNAEHLDIICYDSLKNYKNSYYDIVILDECHHLSELRKEILETIHINEVIIGLSATIPVNLEQWFKEKYDTFILKTTFKDAIESNVLAEPTIYLIPLEFDNEVTEAIYRNVKKTTKVITDSNWINRWMYIKNKIPVRIFCTKRQYIDDLDGQIEWFKRKSLRSQAFKNKWLRLCNDRLKWLSDKKTSYILSLLDHLKYQRTLTFCNNIDQTERLGKNCIHSKNKDADDIINKFNNKKIKHITACQMLDEGANLTDCRIGIFAMINSSERITIQRIGRILRHKKPIIIIPYYKNTREEEIVKEIVSETNYKIINNLNEIEL